MDSVNGAAQADMPAYESVFAEGDPASYGPQETIALTVSDLETLFLYEWYRGWVPGQFGPFSPTVTFGMPRACLEGFRIYQAQRADGVIPEKRQSRGNWIIALGMAAALLLFFAMMALAIAVIPDDVGDIFR